MNQGSGGGGGGGIADPAWLLDIAKKLLTARDLAGGKTFAERALEADPLHDGVDRVLAIADVLLAAQRRRINNHVDLYAVLQLDPSSGDRGASAVRLHYSRLARLLHPSHRQGAACFQSPHFSDAADEAFKLVSEAWAVLSDPAKKELYDKEIDIAAAADLRPNGGSAGGHGTGEKTSAEAGPNAGDGFWTVCTHCFKVYQYARGYEGRTLLCQNCRKAFQAMEMASPPPIVPGSDMYFCAWCLLPLGFPGGPNFLNYVNVPVVGQSAEFGSSGMNQNWSFSGTGHDNMVYENVVHSEPTRTPTTSRKSPRKPRKKATPKRPGKQVGSAGESGMTRQTEMVADPRNRDGTQSKVSAYTKFDGGSNIPKAGCSRAVEVSAEDLDLNFSIDIDAASSILESLSTLPFLKDEEIVACGKIPPHYKGNG